MIKFVYFDVGGVVVKDFSGTDNWDRLWDEVGIAPIDRTRLKEIWEGLNKTECTTFDIDDLLPILREEFKLTIPSDYSLLMGFVNRFEKNETIWPVISEIQNEVPVGLLTDQYPRMLNMVKQAGLMPPIDWQVVIDSSVVKLQKPDDAVYELAEQKAGVSGNEILFIDNKQENLDNAKEKFGWQTILFNPQEIEVSCNRLMAYFNQNK